MKRNELLKKSKKMFAAVLAAAMVANSVVPNNLVFASEEGTEAATEAATETNETVEPAAEPVMLEANEGQPIETEAKESEPVATETPTEAPQTETEAPKEETDEGTETPTESETETPKVTEIPTESVTEETEKTSESEDAAFDQSQTVDGIEVSVSAEEGVFPEGASLNVRKVENQSVLDTFENAVDAQQETSSEDALMEEIRTELEKLAEQGMDDFGVGTGEENELKVFDITVTDENGTEIQPDTSKGNATVSFAGIDTDSSTEEIQVYHANEDLGSVQALDTAADVDAGYAEVTAEHFSYYCVSTLKPGTQFEIHELTSAYANTELTTGIYYVSENTPEFVGADSTSSSQTGGNGLKIADGATVYIYIADGKTLTATGGKGYAGTDGANGNTGSMKTTSYSNSGLTCTIIDSLVNGKGGIGGSGATGGGAAIYVPNDSKIAILGNGSLNATGGTGGNAGNGQNGQKTLYYNASFGAYKGQGVTLYSTTNNVNIKASYSGTCTIASKSFNDSATIGGAGGSGGGGAAGGGAGIGTNGANGNVGATGVAGKVDLCDKEYVDKVSGNSATSTVAASSSGQIYIGNVTVNATGGVGGQEGSQQAIVSKHSHSITYYYASNGRINTYSGTLWVQDGQSGGGGGAGGTGASIGTGGIGGAGGAGGDAGSCWAKSYDANKAGYAPESVRGNNGGTGTNGSGSKSDLSDSQNPYNTVTFQGASSNAKQNYYLAKESVITVPSSSATGFCGWKVTTGAQTLASSFGEHTTKSLLAGDSTIYKAGDTIIVDKLANGNVVLEAVIHSHSWTYESNGNEIKVYCTGENGEDVCGHYGSKKAVTLTVKADSKTYDGTAASVSVENADTVTNLTGEAVTVAYYKTDAEGNTTDQNSFTDAPKDAGNYLAAVTLGKVRAEQKFTISPFEIKEENVILDQDSFEWTGTEIAPVVTVKVSLNGAEQGLTPETDYTLAGTLAATDLSGTDGYTFTVSGTGNFTGSVEKTWKITKKIMTGVSADPVEATYDGASHGITVTGQPDGAEITYGADGKTYRIEQPVCKDVKAGGYTVYYKVTKDSYEDYTGSATVTINPRPITVKAADKEIIYGDAEPEYTSEIIDGTLVEGDTLSGITLARTEGEDVGTYDITASEEKDANPNYSVKFEKGTFTIAQKEIGLTWADTKLTYNGKDQQPSASATGLVGKDTCDVTVTGAMKNAGTYTATAVSVSNRNYKLPAEVTIQYTIVAKEITAIIIPNGGIYEGTITPASAILNGLVGADDLEITLTYTGTANDGTEADGTVPSHAGTYTVTASITDGNYSLKEEGAFTEFVVAKADPALTVSEVADKNYGEEAFNLESTNKGDGQKSYTSSDEKVVTVDENGLVTIVGAGNATLTVSLAESANYTASEKTVTVTVLPKAVTVTPDSLTKVYDEADPDLTYKAEGLVGEDTLSDITLARAEGENAGTYDITAEAKEGANPNYSITCEKGTFTITPKPIDKAEVTLGDALKYTGKEQTQNVAKVTLDGKEIPADAYTVENNTATEAGTYTLTIKAKEDGNYTGTLTWTYVIAPTQDSQIKEDADGSVKIGDGTLKLQVKTEGGVPSASLVTGKAQIIEMLIQSGDITADELAQIAGGASVDIILTVKDGSATVSAAAKAQMESGANGYTIGQYLDISLFKYMTVNGVTKDGIQLRQTAGQITISVSIPENLINIDSKVTRTYAIIRNHDGKVDVLNTTYDQASQTLTFQTNLFSDYAIAYQDVKETETETETEKKSGTTGTSQTTAAKTADITNVAGYGMALLISAMAMAVILLKRRKRTEK